jgi:hypothetical protein
MTISSDDITKKQEDVSLLVKTTKIISGCITREQLRVAKNFVELLKVYIDEQSYKEMLTLIKAQDESLEFDQK